MKKCTKCLIEKDIARFSIDKSKRDQLYSSCKDCVRKREQRVGRIRYRESLSYGYKRCSLCKKVWPINSFNRDSTKRDGLYPRCRSCRGSNLIEIKSKVDNAGYLTERGRRIHRLIMEKRAGRKLSADEHVHHIDGNKLNNKTSNLIILTASDHHRIHKKVNLLQIAVIKKYLEILKDAGRGYGGVIKAAKMFGININTLRGYIYEKNFSIKVVDQSW